MTEIQRKLFELADVEYAAFAAKLTPTLPADSFIGVRVPALRKLAVSIRKDPETESFLDALPHKYYDENLLHSILLQARPAKEYEVVLKRVIDFLPYVDNWAVCDTLRPKAFEKHKEELFPYVCAWIASDETYTCRFGIDMLMSYFLDENFRSEYLELPLKVESEEYYVRMMIAWYYATALAKQWEATVPYIEQHRLPEWTHRKTIQKAIESRKITGEQKAYLRSLK